MITLICGDEKAFIHHDHISWLRRDRCGEWLPADEPSAFFEILAYATQRAAFFPRIEVLI